LGLAEIMNCPNPFQDDTYFTFVSSSDVDSLVINIYTATGRFIQKLETGGLPAGYNQVHWDGLDGDGDRIANGVYFYKIVARAGDQKIVARQKMFKLR
jgi:flagellar hook assembly protein FlgD